MCLLISSEQPIELDSATWCQSIALVSKHSAIGPNQEDTYQVRGDTAPLPHLPREVGDFFHFVGRMAQDDAECE